MQIVDRTNLELDFSNEEIANILNSFLVIFYNIRNFEITCVNPEEAFAHIVLSTLELETQEDILQIIGTKLGEEWMGEYLVEFYKTESIESAFSSIHFSYFIEKTIKEVIKHER